MVSSGRVLYACLPYACASKQRSDIEKGIARARGSASIYTTHRRDVIRLFEMLPSFYVHTRGCRIVYATCRCSTDNLRRTAGGSLSFPPSVGTGASPTLQGLIVIPNIVMTRDATSGHGRQWSDKPRGVCRTISAKVEWLSVVMAMLCCTMVSRPVFDPRAPDTQSLLSIPGSSS